MSIQVVSAEQSAQLFHHYHQALGPDFGCQTDQAHQSWKDVAQGDRSRMVAAARLALLELDFDSMEQEEQENSRRYFARPGEAEWGC